MTLPNVTTVRVTGGYYQPDGTPLSGSITFTPSVDRLTDLADNSVVVRPVVADLVDGQLAVDLAVSDDPDLLPNDWTYTVQESISGYTTTYTIQLVASQAPSVGLPSLAPPAPTPSPQDPNLWDARYGRLGFDNHWTQDQVIDGTVTVGSLLTANTLAVTGTAAVGGNTTIGGDLAVSGTITGTISAVGVGITDWINVTAPPYNAAGDGVADDTAALQLAIDTAAAAGGGVVYVPTGTYGISDSLELKPEVQLRGPHGTGFSESHAVIALLAGFSGTATAAVRMLDQEEGGYATDSQGQSIIDIEIDGSAYNATAVAGVRATGRIIGAQMTNVLISNMSGAGLEATIYTRVGPLIVHPIAWSLQDVHTYQCTGNGFTLNRITDSTLLNCKALGCGAAGMTLTNTINGRFIGCQTEWSGSHGFHITGVWDAGTASGGVLLAGCSTDRNENNGLLVDASNGTAQVMVVGLMCRRDGRNANAGGGNFAAVKCTSSNMPVTLVGLATYPGVDDDGTGTNSPQFGVQASGSVHVDLASGYVHAATTAVSDGGTNTVFTRGANVTTATGTTAAPTRSTTFPSFTAAGNLTIPSGGNQVNIGQSGSSANVAVLRANTTDPVLSTRLSGDSNNRLQISASGDHLFSPGTSATDVTLARSAANTLSVTTADLRIGTAGRGLRVAEGANAKMGTATLTAGAATVANTSVTANSRILLTSNADGGTPGWLRVSARTASTSFTITSSSGTDTSTVAWLMLEPA